MPQIKAIFETFQAKWSKYGHGKLWKVMEIRVPQIPWNWYTLFTAKLTPVILVAEKNTIWYSTSPNGIRSSGNSDCCVSGCLAVFFQYTLQTCKSGFLSFVLEVFSFLLQLITQNLQNLSPSPFFLRAQEMQGQQVHSNVANLEMKSWKYHSCCCFCRISSTHWNYYVGKGWCLGDFVYKSMLDLTVSALLMEASISSRQLLNVKLKCSSAVANLGKLTLRMVKTLLRIRESNTKNKPLLTMMSTKQEVCLWTKINKCTKKVQMEHRHISSSMCCSKKCSYPSQRSFVEFLTPSKIWVKIHTFISLHGVGMEFFWNWTIQQNKGSNIQLCIFAKKCLLQVCLFRYKHNQLKAQLWLVAFEFIHAVQNFVFRCTFPQGSCLVLAEMSSTDGVALQAHQIGEKNKTLNKEIGQKTAKEMQLHKHQLVPGKFCKEGFEGFFA